ncbi:aminopeptidase (homolog to leucyl aminopeptidase / aminopeptidase T) [Natronomonas pharaonis DSM 2160]|uniref:Aminopeptidase (Homolog to leucyl aminopeptidase / aminopeptidase T) n=1 Tax=Natronomonas pharaonis (strain ATCC 35678 / DSM 2160 / CIP 103997 / JCM 8858 / NBRC 14720 / NCIMB 2260 / Gabara) TaxID=348780 RepID=A0A1U7ET90_NATPD|nr:aminopeptidase [Natronomonas pharaonis]CAI48098.1 aminopeptidase (homolog to leucyl aminopeptidase / aminopeptidase T) [Natronomonas pharaonis DSM 2160]
MADELEIESPSAVASAAETAVEQCLAIEAGERCVVVTDDKRAPIGEALYEAALAVTDDATIVRYPPGPQHGAEPPAPVAAAMADADAFLAPTTKSLSHTRARSEASEAGVRGATLPGITESVFTTGLDADYDAIAETTATVYAAVADAERVRVTSPQGTDITFEIGDREWLEDTGIVHEPGSFSNLPAGETFVSPTSADGTYVVDGTIRPHGRLDADQTVTFEVEDGFVTDVDDAAIRDELETAAAEVGEDAYNLAELGIGTNLGVEALVGSVLLDEKAAGTVHIAVGDDAGIGGETDAPIHMDGILREPTVLVDGEELSLPSAE